MPPPVSDATGGKRKVLLTSGWGGKQAQSTQGEDGTDVSKNTKTPKRGETCGRTISGERMSFFSETTAIITWQLLPENFK